MKNKVNRVKEKIEWIQNLTVVRMVQGAMRINKDNQLSAFAAQAAFFLLLSFFSICNDASDRHSFSSGNTGGVYRAGSGDDTGKDGRDTQIYGR